EDMGTALEGLKEALVPTVAHGTWVDVALQTPASGAAQGQASALSAMAHDEAAASGAAAHGSPPTSGAAARAEAAAPGAGAHAAPPSSRAAAQRQARAASGTSERVLETAHVPAPLNEAAARTLDDGRPRRIDRHGAVVPLKAAETTIGALGLMGDYDDRDLEFFEILAGRVALMLDNVRLVT